MQPFAADLPMSVVRVTGHLRVMSCSVISEGFPHVLVSFGFSGRNVRMLGSSCRTANVLHSLSGNDGR